MKKSSDEIRNSVLHALHQIVPEVDLESLNPEAVLRDELDMDSMDFLRFMVKLHAELNMDVPEADYGKLATLKKCLEYCAEKININ